MTDKLDSAKAPSKGAWTPGPWTFFDGGLDGFGIQDGSASGPRLAHVRYGRMSGGKCEGYEIAKANALLISKAPQMAELLRRLIEELPSKRDWLDPDLERAARGLLTELEGKL